MRYFTEQIKLTPQKWVIEASSLKQANAKARELILDCFSECIPNDVYTQDPKKSLVPDKTVSFIDGK